MNTPDFVIDINGYIGTPDTVLPYTAEYYLKHGYKERKINTKLIDEINKQNLYSYGGRIMYLPTNTTLAELHEIKDTCLACYTVDGCDNACPYWRFSVDDYVCAFEPLTQPIDWILPELPLVED